MHHAKEKRNYQYANALKTHREVYLSDTELNLKGIADIIIEYKGFLKVAEIKLSLPTPIPKGYIAQLAALGILAERQFNKPVTHLVFLSDHEEELPYSEKIRSEVMQAIQEVNALYKNGLLPQKTPITSRCEYCEYKKICR